MEPPFFSTPTGIAAIAAASSFVAGVVGAGISSWTIHRTHRQRLNVDERLAERKAAAELALARQKFDYDRAQAVFRRRFELAEHILADAYRFRSLMTFVRSGFSMSGEGEDRPAEGYESETVKRTRDTYFVPIKRLQSENEFLAAMFARRTASQAHFGSDAEKAFSLFHQAMHEVRVASSLLIEWTSDRELAERETMQKLRQDIWQPMARHADKDEIGQKIEDGVQLLEGLCHPVLAWISSDSGSKERRPL